MTRATVEQRMLFYGFDRWGFDAKGWAPRTREKYRWQARRADAWLAEHRGTSIFAATAKDLQAYLFTTKPNARNRNAVRQGLIAFQEFLLAQGLRDSNAAIGLPRLREPRDLPKSLEIDEARRILAVLPAFPIEHQVAVLLMLLAGLRRDECRRLRWSDVRRGWLRFSGKGGKERVLPIKPALASALAELRAGSGSAEWVFPSPVPARRGPVGETAIWRWVKDVAEVAGIELHPHMLRHTFATRLMEVTGGDIRAAQEALGHADPKTTSIYLRVRPARLKDAMDLLSYEEAAPAGV